MNLHRRLTLHAALGLTALAAWPAVAADYPDRAIELVVPSSAGGGTDVMARTFADAARKHVVAAARRDQQARRASGASAWPRCGARRPTATRSAC